MNQKLHIIHGSRTGNSKAIAEVASRYANSYGIKTQLVDMKSMDHSIIKELTKLLLIVSTHGEGDPPAVALNFYNYLHEEFDAPLEQLEFSVLALGDSSYKDYCKTGKDFAKRLKELQAKSFFDLVECDVDFEETARKWIIDSVSVFKLRLNGSSSIEKKDFSFNFHAEEDSDSIQTVVHEKRQLCTDQSTKNVLHLSFSFGESSYEYLPGDSVAIKSTNSRFYVDRLLRQLNFDGTYTISKDEKNRFLKQVLLDDYELSLLTPVVLTKYADLLGDDRLRSIQQDPVQLKAYCANHDLLDLISDFPGDYSPEEFLGVLRKLKPRLYSVASSAKAFPHEVHITMGIMEYELNNRVHLGVTSSFLSDRIDVGERISISIEKNDSFRLPENPNVPIIMIANGTGIAPYRSFLQEREALDAAGKNWLFFGERNAASDFLYKNEILEMLNNGLLTQLDTAFSRDQEDKIYVQDRLLEKSDDVFDWIVNQDAVVYICGNKRTMAADVRKALQQIFSSKGGLTDTEVENYISKMKSEKRWQEDVY